MGQITPTDILANTIATTSGNTITVTGQNLKRPNTVVQIVNYVDTSTGSFVSTSSSSLQYNTLYTFSITPKYTGSNIIIMANVGLGMSPYGGSDAIIDQDNRGLLLYRNGSVMTLNNSGGNYRLNGFYGTDVPSVSGGGTWYGHYHTQKFTIHYTDTTSTSAGVAISYSLVGVCATHNGTSTAWVSYNRAQSSASQGISTYTLMEITK